MVHKNTSTLVYLNENWSDRFSLGIAYRSRLETTIFRDMTGVTEMV